MIRLREKLTGIQLAQIVEIRSDDCPKVNSLHQLDGDVTVGLDRFRQLEIASRSVTVKVLDVWQHRAGGFVIRSRVQHLADLPNLLHQRPWKPDTHDPLQAMRDEPERVDPTTQKRITAQAGTVYAATHADDVRRREAKSLAAQTKETVNRARQRGVDIDDNLERIRAELDAMRRKLSDAA